MVGIQCKSCGHRALATLKPGKRDDEIITQLRQSSAKCSECGGSKVDILIMPAAPDLADIWLKGNPS
jgi:DNA-directed RNA polymerase subunit RPC12/RpoP